MLLQEMEITDLFTDFIMEPLHQMDSKGVITQTHMIVMDALDECCDDKDEFAKNKIVRCIELESNCGNR